MSNDSPTLLPCRAPQADNSLQHGHARHGPTGKASPTYQSWQSMLTRCRRRQDYRKSGIRVCVRWRSFENFLTDMGERPAGTTLDRKDNAKGYQPDNCRWATPRDQARNTRRNKLTLLSAVAVALRMLGGEKASVVAKDLGISESLPREIMRGRTWPDALATATKAYEEMNRG
jgi:hypothetical protein